jgi:quercetin dioxygenase-like cupin family protein
MCAFHDPRRFVCLADAPAEFLPWGRHLWYSKPGLVETKQLLLVQVDMPPGTAHQFHRHPGREEILYVLDGKAEQWVDRSRLELGAGDAAFIPMDTVHGIYNDSDRIVRFLAILSPAETAGPMLVDVYEEEPWRSLRAPRTFPPLAGAGG